MNVIGRVMAGITAFREAYVASGRDSDAFETLPARQMRYLLFWSFYENTAYSNIHNWAVSYKTSQHLYKYIRPIYNPAYRIGEFHKGHIFGGSLNIEDPTRGAIPIQTENEQLLPAIGRLWTDTNMQVFKDIVALRGCIEGDVFLTVLDDPARRKVAIARLDPSTVTGVTFDGVGNVKGYVIEETRQDPESPNRTVKYKMVCSRDGQDVVYQTFRNGAPYGWYGQPSSWAEPYGFVPMVHIKHNDVGLEFGWSEIYPDRPKIQELDEQASLLNDYLRKYHDPWWMISGKTMPSLTVDDGDPGGRGTDAAQSGGYEDQPGRNRIRTITGFSAETKAQALVANMNVGVTIQNMENMQSELEKDFPELQTDIWATGSTSGRALRVARERVGDKIVQRRANYDDGLVRIQQMAIAIGGEHGYQDYQGFSLESYDQGALDHRIRERPVFSPDPMDQGEIDLAEWRVIAAATGAGATLEGVLKLRGWSEEDIALITGDGRVQNTEG